MSSDSLIIVALSFPSIILTIIGNTIFFITLIKTSFLHTPSNVLLGVLCATDLLAGVLCQPLFITLLLSNPGPCCTLLARIFYYIYDLSCWNSFICTLMVTLDRYAAICYPYRYMAYATCRKHIYSTLFIFALTTIYATIKFRHYKNTEVRFLSIDISLQLLVMLAAVAMYIRINKIIRSQRKRIRPPADGSIRRQTRLALREKSKIHTVSIILAVFIGCYTPRTIFDVKCILYYLRKINYDVVLGNWANFFVLLNSCLNPIIYCARIKEIQEAAVKIFMPSLAHRRELRNESSNINENREKRAAQFITT